MKSHILHLFEFIAVLFLVFASITANGGSIDKLSYDTLGQVCVDIETNANGHYMLYADVSIDYEDDSPPHVTLDNPILLAYNIPDKYVDGVCLLSGQDISDMIEHLEYHDISYVLDKLNNVNIYQGAST